MNSFCKLTFVLSYFIPKFVKIECHLHAPSFCLILEKRRGSDPKNFFIATAKNLVCKKSSSPSHEKLKKPAGVASTLPLPLGHRGVNAMKKQILYCLKNIKNCTVFVCFWLNKCMILAIDQKGYMIISSFHF